MEREHTQHDNAWRLGGLGGVKMFTAHGDSTITWAVARWMELTGEFEHTV